MSGTNWVGYQEGSTRQELAEALSDELDRNNIAKKKDRDRIARLLDLYLHPENQHLQHERTPLKLTGRPLNVYDAARIAEAWRINF